MWHNVLMVIKKINNLKKHPHSPDLSNQKDDHQFNFVMWPNKIYISPKLHKISQK